MQFDAASGSPGPVYPDKSLNDKGFRIDIRIEGDPFRLTDDWKGWQACFPIFPE
jgi:hypothetical protein